MSRPPDRASEPAIVGLLVFVFIGALGVLAALVPVGHGFVPKGRGWFTPAVAGGAFTLHPLLIAVRPPVHDTRQHAALAAALLIGAQLLLGYWFYNYLIWFYPLLLVAVIQPPRERRNAKALTDSTGRIGVPGEVQTLLVAAGNTAHLD